MKSTFIIFKGLSRSKFNTTFTIQVNITKPIFNQCSTSTPPENIRNLLVFLGGTEVEHWLKMAQTY